MPKASDPAARVLILREAPVEVPCSRGEGEATCVLLLREDWQMVVIDWKTKCRQLGGTAEHCQTPAEATR